METVYKDQIKDCANEIIAEMDKMLLLPEQQIEILQAVENNMAEHYKER